MKAGIEAISKKQLSIFPKPINKLAPINAIKTPTPPIRGTGLV